MKVIALLIVCFFASALSVTNPTLANLTANDNAALNYALTLEQLEAAFYNQFQGVFTNASFIAAGYPSYVYSYFELIKQHENAHVTALTATLTQRGATPVQPCTYNFGTITTVAQYIGAAKIFENVGVTAYDGAINRIYDTTLQQVAATIATVEARHAAFLNLLAGENPFPSEVDNATAPATVASTIAPYLTNCPSGNPPLPAYLVIIPVVAPSGSPANPSQGDLSQNDLNALNYALTLEHLEATFYDTFQQTYSATDFVNAGYTAAIYNYFSLIRVHERAHVNALASTITSLGGTPVQACTYNFGSVTNVASYVATARVFENVGVSAYDGAVNTIFSGSLKQYAATIATVEARHAAFLNNLTGNIPFPDATDTASAPSTIVTTITPFLNNCPTPLTSLPVVKTVYPYNNATTTSTSGTSTTTTSGSSTTTTSDASSSSLSFTLCVLSVIIVAFASL